MDNVQTSKCLDVYLIIVRSTKNFDTEIVPCNPDILTPSLTTKKSKIAKEITHLVLEAGTLVSVVGGSQVLAQIKAAFVLADICLFQIFRRDRGFDGRRARLLVQTSRSSGKLAREFSELLLGSGDIDA